jgi:hypothetical protein
VFCLSSFAFLKSGVVKVCRKFDELPAVLETQFTQTVLVWRPKDTVAVKQSV